MNPGVVLDRRKRSKAPQPLAATLCFAYKSICIHCTVISRLNLELDIPLRTDRHISIPKPEIDWAELDMLFSSLSTDVRTPLF
jgi:hypothetical protein